MSAKTDKAVSYGATGAMIGSAGGPVGAAIGGGLGAAYGFFSGGSGFDRAQRAEDKYGGVDARGMQVPHFQQQYGQYGQIANQRGALGQQLGSRVAPISNGVRGSQMGLGSILSQEARGQGVGQQLVRMQAQQAADRASQQQFAAVGGARPGMQAMAARNAMLGSSIAQSAVGGQAALGSAQMTLGAQGLYGNHLQSVRGQDENTALQSRAINDRAQSDAYGQQLQALGQRQGLSGMQQQGAMTAEQLRAQRYAALMGAPTSGEIAAGGLMGAAGAYFGSKG